MKKIIYLLMLIVSTLVLNSAYAVENFTNSQDLGAGQVQTNQDGSITIPNTQNQEKQKMGDAVKSGNDWSRALRTFKVLCQYYNLTDEEKSKLKIRRG